MPRIAREDFSEALRKAIGDETETARRGRETETTGDNLLDALKDLYEISGEANIPLINSKAVRKMGKFMAARDKAKAAIERAEASGTHSKERFYEVS